MITNIKNQFSQPSEDPNRNAEIVSKFIKFLVKKNKLVSSLDLYGSFCYGCRTTFKISVASKDDPFKSEFLKETSRLVMETFFFFFFKMLRIWTSLFGLRLQILTGKSGWKHFQSERHSAQCLDRPLEGRGQFRSFSVKL